MLTAVVGYRYAPSCCSQPFLHPPDLRQKHRFLGKLQFLKNFPFFFLWAESPGGGCVFFLWCHHLETQGSPGVTFPCLLQTATSAPKGSGRGPKSFGYPGSSRIAAPRDTHEMALEPQLWCWEKSALGIRSQKFPVFEYLTQSWGFSSSWEPK